MSKMQELANKYNKEFKEEVITFGAHNFPKLERVPFSSIRLNRSMYGGLPLGRMTMFGGAPGSGKSTTTLDVIKNHLELYPTKNIFFLDAERALDETWATTLGVDLDRLYLSQPTTQTAEELLQMTMEFVQTGETSLVVIDSLPALVTKSAREKDMSEAPKVANLAALLSRWLPQVDSLIRKNGTTVIFINQIRDIIGDMSHGTNIIGMYPGGNALRHHCSEIIHFSKGKPIDENFEELPIKTDSAFGHKINYRVLKSKTHPFKRTIGFWTLTYDDPTEGNINDLIDVLMTEGELIKDGAMFTFGEQKFRGFKQVVKYFRDNREIAILKLNELSKKYSEELQ